ncbi:MAG: hypothetical protein SVR08_11945 [Spirochaetota bacterium]|nr:hypothetical protein [Spirochaetota bacterium]
MIKVKHKNGSIITVHPVDARSLIAQGEYKLFDEESVGKRSVKKKSVKEESTDKELVNKESTDEEQEKNENS